mgnify:CR=1 FL=1
MGEQIVCSNCLSNADSGLPACPYCGQSFENTNPAGTLPVNTLLAGRYTIGRVLALDGEGVLYAAIDNSATRRVVVKEYVPVTICAARSRDGSVIPRQGREVLFKTTRMDFVDLYRSLVALGRNDGLVQVLDLIEKLKADFNTSLLLITHDLGIVAEVCDKAAIMYAGRIVEYGNLEHIYNNTKHPYTVGLFGSIPNFDENVRRLKPIPGLMPDPTRLPEGCAFAPRCPHATDRCRQAPIPVVEVEPGHLVECVLFEQQGVAGA